MIKLKLLFVSYSLYAMNKDEFLSNVIDDCFFPHLVEEPQREDFHVNVEDFSVEQVDNSFYHKGTIEICCKNSAFNRYIIKNLLNDLKLYYPESNKFTLTINNKDYNELNYTEEVFKLFFLNL